MKFISRFIIIFLASTSLVFAEDATKALVDARLELIKLKLRFREEHPTIIAAKSRVDILSTATISPTDYRQRVEQILIDLKAEDTALAQRYSENHPNRLGMTYVIKAMQQELQRFPTKTPP